MVNRYSMLRLSIVTCLSFLSLLMFSFSCADHVVPTNPVPAKIKTLNVVRNGTNTSFGVQFEDLGNIPITEFGTVFVEGSVDATPDLSNIKLIVTPPADLSQRFRPGPGLLFAPANPVYRFSYRAYAMLGNGSVVFGEVKNATFTPD